MGASRLKSECAQRQGTTNKQKLEQAGKKAYPSAWVRIWALTIIKQKEVYEMFDKAQIEAHRKQAEVAEQTRHMILQSCELDEIMSNKYLREAMGY